MVAVNEGKNEIVEILIQKGADLKVVNSHKVLFICLCLMKISFIWPVDLMEMKKLLKCS